MVIARTARTTLLAQATEIAREYKDEGYSLTLRQLFYQLVAKALIPNADESYKRLGDVLGDARLAGEFDMDLIIDRGRDAKPSKHHECKLDVNVALDEAGSYLRALPHWSIAVDRWFGQPNYVSCWVEKEALAGVFEKPSAYAKRMTAGKRRSKSWKQRSAPHRMLASTRSATTKRVIPTNPAAVSSAASSIFSERTHDARGSGRRRGS